MNMSFVINGFLEVLITLYRITGNLGFSLIAFTLLIRSLLLPLTIPSLNAQKKIRELQPHLNELKRKHKNDKAAMQTAQMELYKKYNVNPLAGCLPQLVQIAILIVLYQALIKFLGTTEFKGTVIDPYFLWLNLAKPDQYYVLPVLAGVTQLILSLMILPGGEVRDIVPNQSKNRKVQIENEKEEDVAEMAATMQQQMVFLMPFMTAFIAISFPSGLGLYWIATTVFSIVQQYFISGWGGLLTYSQRAVAILTGKKV